MYAQQTNGVWTELRGNIVFSANVYQTAESLTDEQRAEFNVYKIIETQPPSHDINSQVVERNGYVFNKDSQQWEMAWLVRPMTAEEFAARAEQIKAEIVAATQERLDTFARTRNYDGILSACTYASSTVPKFRDDGQYCVNARDATWYALYQFMAEVELGQRPVPTGYADVEPSLPALEWPA